MLGLSTEGLGSGTHSGRCTRGGQDLGGEEEKWQLGTSTNLELVSEVTELFQAYGMSSLGSSLPSGSKKSSAPSETGTDVSGHVLIAPPVSPGRATTSRGRTQANGSNDYSRQRSNSQESVNTTDTRETSTTTTSRVRWDNIGIEPLYRRPRGNGSAVVRWIKQEGGHKKTAIQKAEDDVQRFAKQAANQQRVRDDDDDDSASSYEM